MESDQELQRRTLGDLNALLEDPGLILGTHMAVHNHLVVTATTSPGGDPSFGFRGPQEHRWYTDTHAGKTPTHVLKQEWPELSEWSGRSRKTEL